MDNGVKPLLRGDRVPQNGDVLVYDAAQEGWVPGEASSVWTEYVKTYSDFVVGNESSGSAEITVATIPANTFIEEVLVRIDSGNEFNDPGDGTVIILNLTFKPNLLPAEYIDGATGHFIVTKTDLEGVQVSEVSRTLSIVLQVDADAAHTLNEITTGTLSVLVKTSQLP